VAAAFALIFTCLIAGYLCARFAVLPLSASDAFNRFIIYICLPALVLRLIPKLAWQPALLVLVIAPWLAAAFGVVVVLGVSRWLRFSREVTGALLLCVAIGNTSFLGFPMIDALLGSEAVGYAALYDQLGSFLILGSYGSYVVARMSGSAKPTFAAILARVVRFPPFIALLLGFVPIRHPDWVDYVLGRLGDALVPIAMFAVGMRVELRKPADGAALATGLVVKMLAAPLLIFGFARVLGAPALPAQVAVLEAAMPPSVTAAALAMTAGFAPALSAALAGYGIVLSTVLLPAMAAVLARLF
jgi:malate permease and related proteins